jgi:hypothetical protein
MPGSDTAVVTLNSSINSGGELNESFNLINSRVLDKRNQEKKEKRHISFMERVKYFYFDLEQPVSTPSRKGLEMKNLNFVYYTNDSKQPCTLDSFKLKNYNLNTFDNSIRLEGSVLVKNFAYEKKVTVRYSLTEWKTYSDIESFYLDSMSQDWDRFEFVVRIDPVLFKSNDYLIISLAIKYETLNLVYWDNNYNENHRFILNIR